MNKDERRNYVVGRITEILSANNVTMGEAVAILWALVDDLERRLQEIQQGEGRRR